MKVIRNYQIFRAQRLASRGDFKGARRIADRLVSKFPKSIGYNLFIADIELFSGELKKASMLYETCKELVNAASGMSARNKRFCNAYINFRQIAIGYRLAGKEWSQWQDVAKTINELDADRNLKTLFPLPV